MLPVTPMADGFILTDEGRIRLSVHPTERGNVVLRYAVPVHSVVLDAQQIAWLIEELQRAQTPVSAAVGAAHT